MGVFWGEFSLIERDKRILFFHSVEIFDHSLLHKIAECDLFLLQLLDMPFSDERLAVLDNYERSAQSSSRALDYDIVSLLIITHVYLAVYISLAPAYDKVVNEIMRIVDSSDEFAVQIDFRHFVLHDIFIVIISRARFSAQS